MTGLIEFHEKLTGILRSCCTAGIPRELFFTVEYLFQSLTTFPANLHLAALGRCKCSYSSSLPPPPPPLSCKLSTNRYVTMSAPRSNRKSSQSRLHFLAFSSSTDSHHGSNIKHAYIVVRTTSRKCRVMVVGVKKADIKKVNRPFDKKGTEAVEKRR